MMNKQLIEERIGLNLSEEDFLKIPQSYFQAELLGKIEEDELKWFLENYPNLEIPQHIPSHQVRCIVMREKEGYMPETVTDFLRFGIYLIGGNPDLPHIKKVRQVEDRNGKKKVEFNPEYRNFKNLPRSERRKILLRLENFLGNLGDDDFLSEIKGYQPQWKVFMDRYHPKDFKGICPKVYKLFTIITDKDFLKPIRTWNSTLQKKYDSGEKISSIATYTSSRPKEFLERLNSFLVRSKNSVIDTDDIISCIWNLPDVKNRDLIEALEFFDGMAGGPSINLRGSFIKLRSGMCLDLGVTNIIRENLGYRLAKNIKDQAQAKDLSSRAVYVPDYLKSVPIGRDYSVVPEEVFQVPTEQGPITLCFSGVQRGFTYLISTDFTTARRSKNNGYYGTDIFQVFFMKEIYTQFPGLSGGNYMMAIIKQSSRTKKIDLGYVSKGTTKRTLLGFPLFTTGRERTKKTRSFEPREYPLGIIINPSTGEGKSFEVSPDGKLFVHGRTMYSYDLLKLYIQEHGGKVVDEKRNADLVMDYRDINKILGK